MRYFCFGYFLLVLSCHRTMTLVYTFMLQCCTSSNSLQLCDHELWKLERTDQLNLQRLTWHGVLQFAVTTRDHENNNMTWRGKSGQAVCGPVLNHIIWWSCKNMGCCMSWTQVELMTYVRYFGTALKHQYNKQRQRYGLVKKCSWKTKQKFQMLHLSRNKPLFGL